jgi:riboflavin kinase/FMN adenylyltransferase
MIIVHADESLPAYDHSVISVGNFDGVHLGHKALIDAVVNRAREKKAASVILTFEPHTRAVLNAGSPLHLLATCPEKEILMRDLGIDVLACLPFTRTMASMLPVKFVDTVLSGRFKAIEWVMGENHAFGRNREGTKDFLRSDMGRKHISMFTVALSSQPTAVISSTRIRSRIVEGRIREAVEMLGHPYLIAAERVSGTQTGTTLGFPTLNFKLPPSQKVIPPPGVYAAQLEWNTRWWNGALYIGNCPTFAERDYHFEFHALSGDTVFPGTGEKAALWIQSFIRKDQVFESTNALVSMIHQDISQIREFFNKE